MSNFPGSDGETNDDGSGRSGPMETTSDVVWAMSPEDRQQKRKRLANGKLLQQEKQRRFEEKKARLAQLAQADQERRKWCMERQDFVRWITDDDVARVRRECRQLQESQRLKSKRGNRDEEVAQERAVDTHDHENSTNDSHNKEDGVDSLSHLLRPYLDLKLSTFSSSEEDKNGAHKEGDKDVTSTTKTTTATTTALDSRNRFFIAEGTEPVRLLVRQQTASPNRNGDYKKSPVVISIHSILVKPATLFDEPSRLLTELEDHFCLDGKNQERAPTASSDGTKQLPCPPFRLLVGAESTLSQIAGFPMARGAMACGVVPSYYDEPTGKSTASIADEGSNPSISSSLSQRISHFLSASSPPWRVLALDGVCDAANMGSVIRTAAGLGAHLILVSQDSCDAWYRRSVRVSMGYIALIPVLRVSDLAEALGELHAEAAQHGGMVSFAAVVPQSLSSSSSSSSESTVWSLQDIVAGQLSSWCLVVGNEGNGISHRVVQACSHRITVPMAFGVDSLSLPIATGILLHGLRERESPKASQNSHDPPR